MTQGMHFIWRRPQAKETFLIGQLVVVLLDVVDLEAVKYAMVASLLSFMFGQIHFSSGTSSGVTSVTHDD
jgi:hypothetical protein